MDMKTLHTLRRAIFTAILKLGKQIGTFIAKLSDIPRAQGHVRPSSYLEYKFVRRRTITIPLR